MEKRMTNKDNAFTEALALESIPETLKDCDSAELIRFARTVAYKVANNLKNGFEMSPEDDPLDYGEAPVNTG
jgi:hypothetical protein